MCIGFNTEGVNIFYLCPFICFFCLVLASYVSGLSHFGKFAFIQNMIVSLGEILAIIPHLISVKIQKKTFKKKSGRKTKGSKSSKKTLSLQYEYNDQEESIRQIPAQNILLLGFVDFLQSLNFFYGNYFTNYQIYCWSSHILFLCIFTKNVLALPIYKHHLVSLAIFFILDVVHIIFVLLDEYIECKKIIFIFLIVSSICFSFELVYEKKLMESHFISVYQLCFLVGLSTFFFSLIISIIMTVISSFLEKKIEFIFSYSYYFEEISGNIFMEIIAIVIYMLLTGCYNIFQFLTIKNLSPSHSLITQILLAFFCSLMNKLFMEMKDITWIISITVHSVCIVTLFIFLEVIELKFCGIDKNTKHNISKRANLEKYMDQTCPDETINENDDTTYGHEITDESKNEGLKEQTGSLYAKSNAGSTED